MTSKLVLTFVNTFHKLDWFRCLFGYVSCTMSFFNQYQYYRTNRFF